MMSVQTAVQNALCEVYDPCSQAWSRPLSLVDLGLVREVELDATGHARVRISLTAPFCMAVATILQSVEHRVARVPGVSSVQVDIDTETPWRPDLMTEQGRRELARRRAGERIRILHPLSERST